MIVDRFVSPGRLAAPRMSPTAALNIIGDNPGRICMKTGSRRIHPATAIKPSRPTGIAQNSAIRFCAARNRRIIATLMKALSPRSEARDECTFGRAVELSRIAHQRPPGR